VLAISDRWLEPQRVYRNAFNSITPPMLGEVQFVNVTNDITVANIIGQHGIRSLKNKSAPAPIRYGAIRSGLHTIARHAHSSGATIHMPRIGTGLAGGNWRDVEPIIKDTLVAEGLDVFVYDFKGVPN